MLAMYSISAYTGMTRAFDAGLEIKSASSDTDVSSIVVVEFLQGRGALLLATTCKEHLTDLLKFFD
jgi:hypothetical protein